jgi:hypothetical protein
MGSYGADDPRGWILDFLFLKRFISKYIIFSKDILEDGVEVL